MLKCPCDSGVNPAWQWCAIFLMCSRIQCASIWLRIFASILIENIGLMGKDPDAGKDRRQEEKGTAEDDMVVWHHGLDGHESE